MVGTGIVAAGALTAPIPVVNLSTPKGLAIGGAIISLSLLVGGSNTLALGVGTRYQVDQTKDRVKKLEAASRK